MNVFITGITGTLGTAIARLLCEDRGNCVFGCARNESNVVKFRSKYSWAKHIHSCDAAAIRGALPRGIHIDRVYHCAAMKHVEHCEQCPNDAIAQNIHVLQTVIEVCRADGCQLIFPSSDKACFPHSLYGTTKLIGEKLVISAGQSVVRLGNLLGSSGSVFSKWKADAAAGRPVSLTSREMTRFFITPEDAAAFMCDHAQAGIIVAPCMQSANMGELADLWPKTKIIGLRPGERLHEWIIAPGEQAESLDYGYSIGSGVLYNDGMLSSANAPRWSTQELVKCLARAGCSPPVTNYETAMFG